MARPSNHRLSKLGMCSPRAVIQKKEDELESLLNLGIFVGRAAAEQFAIRSAIAQVGGRPNPQHHFIMGIECSQRTLL